MSRNLIVHSAAAAFTALALVGCGGEPTEAPTSESPTPVETTESPSPTPEPSPTEEPLPTDDTPLEASDGTDLDACYEGTCEVAVEVGSVIEFDDRFDVGGIQVAQFMEDGLILALQSGTTFTLYTGASGSAGGGDGTELVGYTLMSVSGDTAIISFYPRERDTD
jgi:hypothetical protein